MDGHRTKPDLPTPPSTAISPGRHRTKAEEPSQPTATTPTPEEDLSHMTKQQRRYYRRRQRR
jgi:hypothetical protein